MFGKFKQNTLSHHYLNKSHFKVGHKKYPLITISTKTSSVEQLSIPFLFLMKEVSGWEYSLYEAPIVYSCHLCPCFTPELLLQYERELVEAANCPLPDDDEDL